MSKQKYAAFLSWNRHAAISGHKLTADYNSERFNSKRTASGKLQFSLAQSNSIAGFE